MALPTAATLITLDYSYCGEPFCNVEAKSLTTVTLDYSFRAEPFFGAVVSGGGTDMPQQ